jgi:hypothetical protein
MSHDYIIFFFCYLDLIRSLNAQDCSEVFLVVKSLFADSQIS